jgi:sodium transport system permease protein
MFQIKQFMREQALKILIIDGPRIDDLPPLVEGDHFAESLFLDASRAELLRLDFYPQSKSTKATADELRKEAQRTVCDGEYEAVVFFPPNFVDQLKEFRAQLLEQQAKRKTEQTLQGVPSPEIFYNTAQEKSQVAFHRVSAVLEQWMEAIGQQNLKDSKLPASAARPFAFSPTDVASEGHRDAAVWSKILPVVLLIWALTGAFYPAVDLCAGEKERGTLETLLSSPAERSEIVCGKLLTIMLFSMLTSILNLVSMGLTAWFVVGQMATMAPAPLGMPPLSVALWLLVALVPISALFSALCLALAALARSTKEGQYYLMPLILITMPLVILPMAPAVELTLGNSLIPVTGVVLLLRSVLEGNYLQELPYIIPVTAVTLGCCVLAIRWAVDQFNSESVMFRGAERLDLGLWLRHLIRDRGDTPTVGQALLCGILILTVRFFLTLSPKSLENFTDFAIAQSLYLLVGVAGPAILMALALTRRPGKTLLLRRPPWAALPVAVALALVMHPVVKALTSLVMQLYPVDPRLHDLESNLIGLLKDAQWWQMLLVLAAVPAVCEELAFRGFILSGLRHMGHKWQAIVISSLFFGITHLVIQQSLIASLVGVVIGYVAVQTGSLLPGILFHFVHNSIGLLAGHFVESPYRDWFLKVSPEGDYQFHWWVVLLAIVGAFGLLDWFRRLPDARSPEEKLQETIDQPAAHVAA